MHVKKSPPIYAFCLESYSLLVNLVLSHTALLIVRADKLNHASFTKII